MPATPRSTRTGPRCDAVLDVARQVLVDHGLERFVMRDIASRAAMRLGNLQYYYPTREDLLEDVIRAEFERDLITLRTVIEPEEGSASGRSKPLLTDVARALLDNWCSGGASVCATLYVLSFHHERFAALSQTIYDTFFSELAAMIRWIDPSVDDAESIARARMVTSILDGVALQIRAGLDDCASAACADLLGRATELIEMVAAGRSRGPRADR